MPKWLTTVTSFSKILAIVLFFAFPIVGLILGYKYGLVVGKTNSPIVKETVSVNKLIPTSIPFKNIDSSNWTTFTSKMFGYSFRYPQSYYIIEEKKSMMGDGSYWVEIKSRKDIHTYGANKEDLELWIIVKPITTTTSLETVGNDKLGNIPYEKQSNLVKTTIAGIPALRWRTINGPGEIKQVNGKSVEDEASQEMIVFVYKDRSYSIVKFPADTFRQNEFEAILSSFKFN